MMKKTLIAATLLASSSAALADIEANVTLASDYVFRGVSQTDNQFAIQGGFDWSHDSGFYLGTWASNVDSQFFGGATDPQIELDLYGGFAGDFGDSGLGYDIGYLRYQYPGGDDFNTNEIYGVLSYMGFSGSVNYSNELNFVGSNDDGWYWKAAYDHSFPHDVSLSAHLGYSTGGAFTSDDALGGAYTDWSIGASVPVLGVDLGLVYTDTNVSSSDCGGNVCDAKLVATIGKSF